MRDIFEAAELPGFSAVETRGVSRWRWALGPRQTVRFTPDPGFRALQYSLFLPIADTELVVRVGGEECLRVRSARTADVVRGVLAFPRDGEVEISVSRHNAGPDRFCDDERPLAYSVEKLRLTALPPTDIRDTRARALEAQRTGTVSPSFCVIPFLQLYTTEEGHVLPCCISKEEVWRNGLDAVTDTPLAGDQSLTELWNLPHLRLMRREMLAGVRPMACRKCFEQEDAGAESHRQRTNRPYLDDALAMLDQVEEDGRIDRPPPIVDARLGNLCNLKCRMCSPAASIALAQDFQELYGRDSSPLRRNPWYETDALVEKLAQSLSHDATLIVAGGEPLAIPQFRRLQRRLIELGHAPRIRLRLFSNGTTLTSEATALFPAFRDVGFTFSIDGSRDVNGYIRFPSSFDLINANLRRLHDTPQPFRLGHVDFNTAVQIYNIFDLPNLFRYLVSFPKFFWFPALSTITFPEALAVTVLPRASRVAAKESLERYLAEERWKEIGPVRFEYAEARLRELIRYLDGEDHTHLLPEFFRLTEHFDRKRSQIFPGIPGLTLAMSANASPAAAPPTCAP
jgi:sulfatase maturation enzyme AslB (radical SAM superfamily)